tara:strand:- start:90 stop:806 length:717 start_codon:yes stop_codon:yes gene_type:complete
MMVSLLKADTDVTFDKERQWNEVVGWPMKPFDSESPEFKILSLRYQRLAAHCNQNSELLEAIDSELVDAEIEYGQAWLAANYVPTKDKLREIKEFEFTRFVTFLDQGDLASWMDNPTSECLHWNGTRDDKTHTAMFFRSTKLSGKKVRRNSTVKEVMYQFFIANLEEYQALYLDFDKCKHQSCCVNPHHYIVMRKQRFNNCKKRKAMIVAAKEQARKAKEARLAETQPAIEEELTVRM